jgi:acetyl-CoA carboxylase carboxyltransferase component
MSDYKILIRKQSQVFLGGPPLVKMATEEHAGRRRVPGAADMHATVSGLGDYLAEDENGQPSDVQGGDCASCTGASSVLHPLLIFSEPLHDPDELARFRLPALRASPSISAEVIARITDASDFEELQALYRADPYLRLGQAYTATRWAFSAITAPCFPSWREKAGAVHSALQSDRYADHLPSQHHGLHRSRTDFEQGGITKNGSKMINACRNRQVPHISIIVGAPTGAGNYGMSGRAFGPRSTFLWPTAKIAVMGPEQMAGVMSIVGRASAKRRGVPFDEEADAKSGACRALGGREIQGTVRHLAHLG